MGQLKYHNGTDWVPLNNTTSDYSALVFNDPVSGTVDGTNTTFNTTRDFSSISVYLNGVKQFPGASNDYTVAGANEIEFNEAPKSGSIITADFSTSSSFTVTGTNSFVTKQAVTGSIDGINKDFTTAEGYMGGTLEVYVNGLRQGIAHVTESNPGAGTFTLDTAPLTGSIVEVGYMMAGIPSGNADTVDSYHASQSTTPNTVVVRDDDGGIPLASTDPLYLWMNRTWHNLDSSRSLGVEYTNARSYPIELNVSIDHPLATTGRQARLIINGVIVADTYATSSTNNVRVIIPVSATVPPGATYQVNIVASTPAIFRWAEMY